MFADRTNLATSPKRHSKLGDVNRLSKSGATGSNNLLESDLRSQDEDEESFRKIKDEISKIPSLAVRFDEVFGAQEERTAGDSAVLKKIPPDPRQPIASKAMEFLRQETTRLSEGYKTLRGQRDACFLELVEVQALYKSLFDRGLLLASRIRQDNALGVKKLQELEAKWINYRLQAARAKAGLEGEAITRAEISVQEQRKLLQAAQERLQVARAKETAAQDHAEQASNAATEHRQSLAAARQQLSELQKLRLLADAKHTEVLEGEISRRTRAMQAQEEEFLAVERKLSLVLLEKEKLTNETSKLRSDLQKKEAQFESLKERALDAEAKLNAKDGNVNLALQTLRQSQEYSENRIEVLTKENGEVQEHIDQVNLEKTSMTDKLFETSGVLDRLRDRTEQMSSKVIELERKVQDADAKLHSCLELAESARADAAHKAVKYLEVKDSLDRALDALNKEQAKVEEALAETDAMRVQEQETERELVATKTALERVKGSPRKMARILQEAKEEEELKRRAGDANYYKDRVEKLLAEIEQTKKKLFDADTQRRALLNEVQNLKGNIRVIARVRPPSASSLAVPETERSKIVCSVDCMNLSLDLRGNQQRRGSTSSSSSVESHAFTFNRVFDRETSQEAVFEEVSSFVQSALDGYSVCLFSYGQTGSGKTWTMTGDLSHPTKRGIIPRSVDHILDSISQMKGKGWDFDVECTFIEIYNEAIRDLLAIDPKAEKNARHDIQHRGGGIVITNIRKVAVSNAEEVQVLLEQADIARSVAATGKNNESSRSHSVFTIHIVGRSPDKAGSELLGSLSLCDLAGSERLKTSLATGDRLKETQAINTSLSMLGTVFTALGQKAAHIPFRNSVLTHILSPCLSGDGKTLMIVNLSSDHEDAHESLCSLRFAQLVNKTELGKAKKHVRESQTTTTTTGAGTRSRTNSQ